MDGAKMITDTVDRIMVDRCSAWAEAFLKMNVDRVEIRILAIVGT